VTDKLSDDLLFTRLLGIYLELNFDESTLKDQLLLRLIQQIKSLPTLGLINICNQMTLECKELFINKVINFENEDERINFIIQRIEEAIYSNHRRLRNWLVNALHAEKKSAITQWINNLKELMRPWIEDPDGFIESYFCFMLKKDVKLNSLYNDSCQTLISYLLGLWDGISTPYVRKYPQFNLIKSSLISSQNETSMDQQKLRGLGELWITFYFDGYDS
jgi:hypothetical protein